MIQLSQNAILYCTTAAQIIHFQEKDLAVMQDFQKKFFGKKLEHKTCDILAAERLRLTRFDNRSIIDSFLYVYSNGNFPLMINDNNKKINSDK